MTPEQEAIKLLIGQFGNQPGPDWKSEREWDAALAATSLEGLELLRRVAEGPAAVLSMSLTTRVRCAITQHKLPQRVRVRLLGRQHRVQVNEVVFEPGTIVDLPKEALLAFEFDRAADAGRQILSYPGVRLEVL